jgi:DNA-binding LacI/PurR family transcriptional regulator
VLTFPAATLAEELALYEEMMLVGQVDGFVLSNTNLGDQRVRALLDAGFPLRLAGARAGRARVEQPPIQRLTTQP